MSLKLLIEENYWLLLVFALYLLTLLVFSVIYYSTYVRSPQSFSFNVDILKSQSEIFKHEAEKQVTLLVNKLEAFKELEDVLKRTPNPFPRVVNETSEIQAKDYTFVFSSPVVDAAIPAMLSQYGISVYDKNGECILTMLSHQFPNIIGKTEKKLGRQKRLLATLSGEQPMVWSYWDFLYFSVITQATVGYGDILPNSTFVRMLVVVQTLLALIFLVVVINLVFHNTGAVK